MPPFIDIHCHLTWPSIYSNLSEVIGNAEKAGVIMLTNGIDKDSNRLSLEISKKVRARIPDELKTKFCKKCSVN